MFETKNLFSKLIKLAKKYCIINIGQFENIHHKILIIEQNFITNDYHMIEKNFRTCGSFS